MRSDGILGIIDSLKHRKLDKLDLSFNYVKSNKKESVAISLREIKNIDNLKV